MQASMLRSRLSPPTIYLTRLSLKDLLNPREDSVDRAETIKEGERTNNQASTSLTLTKPSGCLASLEFSDAFVWPADKSKIQLSAPGVTNLRVTAACNKGDWALVLWSTKGTSPGFQFGNVAIPLNFDPIATPFSIANANSGPFYLFLSTLDSAGQSMPLVFLGQARHDELEFKVAEPYDVPVFQPGFVFHAFPA